MTTKAPVRVGIIGYGRASRIFHLPFVTRNPDMEVVAFCQRSGPESGKPHCTVDFPKSRWHRTMEEFCSDPDIDLALVLSGGLTHFALAEQVLESGKHGKSSC
jgi:predicted dehydrogenase